MLFDEDDFEIPIIPAPVRVLAWAIVGAVLGLMLLALLVGSAGVPS